MTTTPRHNLPLPTDGQSPWGNDYRAAMTIIDTRLPAVGGSMYAEENTDATPIIAEGIAVKANLPTQEGPPCPCIEHSTNRLTAVFPNGPRNLLLVATFVLTSSNNQTIKVEVRKNGEPIPGGATRVRKGVGASIGNGALAVSAMAATGDFFEIWVTNETSPANVTITDMTLALRG